MACECNFTNRKQIDIIDCEMWLCRCWWMLLRCFSFFLCMIWCSKYCAYFVSFFFSRILSHCWFFRRNEKESKVHKGNLQVIFFNGRFISSSFRNVFVIVLKSQKKEWHLSAVTHYNWTRNAHITWKDVFGYVHTHKKK